MLLVWIPVPNSIESRQRVLEMKHADRQNHHILRSFYTL